VSPERAPSSSGGRALEQPAGADVDLAGRDLREQGGSAFDDDYAKRQVLLAREPRQEVVVEARWAIHRRRGTTTRGPAERRRRFRGVAAAAPMAADRSPRRR
jgi:hypothetical protein